MLHSWYCFNPCNADIWDMSRLHVPKLARLETLRILTIHKHSRDFETFQARQALQVVDICCQIAERARLLFVEMT